MCGLEKKAAALGNLPPIVRFFPSATGVDGTRRGHGLPAHAAGTTASSGRHVASGMAMEQTAPAAAATSGVGQGSKNA